jgi:hypothetical protein
MRRTMMNEQLYSCDLWLTGTPTLLSRFRSVPGDSCHGVQVGQLILLQHHLVKHHPRP